jgi:hypothetical protein
MSETETLEDKIQECDDLEEFLDSLDRGEVDFEDIREKFSNKGGGDGE